MKKLFLLISLFGLINISYAQENEMLTNKKGNPILPEAGDFGFGISANPFLNYAGNLFSNSGYNSLQLSLPEGAFYGKYFLNANTALRLKLDLVYASSNITNSVENDLDANAQVQDVMSESNTNLSISVGYEKRKGAARTQFIYGAELSVSMANNKRQYTYGNSYTTENYNPTSTFDFNSGATYRTINRNLETNTASGIGAGIRAFAGIEYFILPKISVGGEVGLGYTHYFRGKVATIEETWNFNNNSLDTENNEIAKNRSVAAQDISNGMIFILFYF